MAWRGDGETIMKTTQVTVVRIYLSEKEGQLESLLRRLHDWEKVRGVTVFRGIRRDALGTPGGSVAGPAGSGGIFRCAG